MKVTTNPNTNGELRIGFMSGSGKFVLMDGRL
jgi:hypothetical protein